MKDLQKKTEDYQHSFIIGWLIIAALFITLMLGTVLNVQGQTRDSVYNYCVEIGISNPEFVTAQVMYETAHLKPTSLGCRNNNLLCFRWGSFLEFDCWQSSLNYYLCWMERKGIYRYKNLETLLINEWGAGDMKVYIETVNQIKNK